MSSEANKAVVLRYYDQVLNGGEIDLLDEIAVEPYEEHDSLPGQQDRRDGRK